MHTKTMDGIFWAGDEVIVDEHPTKESRQNKKLSKLLLVISLALGLALASFILPGISSAASNPSGTGQPSAECGDENASVMPAGFETGGFAKAEDVYAGSENSQSSDNSHAVSQYDVACFQLTSN